MSRELFQEQIKAANPKVHLSIGVIIMLEDVFATYVPISIGADRYKAWAVMVIICASLIVTAKAPRLISLFLLFFFLHKIIITKKIK